MTSARSAAAPYVAALDEVPAPARWFHVPPAALTALGAALACATLVTLWTARESVVRAVPRTASLYAAMRMPVNVSGLVFERLAPERLASSDVTIRGAMRNVAGRKIVVPRLAFEVRNAEGSTLVSWSEDANARMLGAGRTLSFASSPHRLPSDSQTVLVRFE